MQSSKKAPASGGGGCGFSKHKLHSGPAVFRGAAFGFLQCIVNGVQVAAVAVQYLGHRAVAARNGRRHAGQRFGARFQLVNAADGQAGVAQEIGRAHV